MKTQDDWQNLSIWVSESVILGGSRVTDEVTIPYSTAENIEFLSRRTSDFRHLGLWPLECDSTSELVIQPKQSNGDEDNINAETKGLLTDRIADCGGDHPDHRRDCYPEPAACAYCSQRVVRRGVDSHLEHSTDFLQLRLPHSGLCGYAGPPFGHYLSTA